MLKKKKLVMVVVMLIVALFIMTVSYNTKASDNPVTLDNLDLSTGNDTGSVTGGNTVTLDDTNDTNTADIGIDTNDTNDISGELVQPSTDNDVEEDDGNEETLPQTGVTEDITVVFFIVVCVVSAIYAYIKIRDYRG